MNYFSVSGASSSADTSGSFYLEKTLSANSSVSLLGGIRRLSVDTGPETGWDNISVSYKQVIASMRTHEFAFALNPFLETPTGTTKTGAESHARWGIELLAEKGFADLPESLRELQPAAVEGDVAWETKVTRYARRLGQCGEASLESARQGDHRRGGALGAGEKPAPGLRMGMNAE